MDGKKFRMTQTQKRGALWLSVLLVVAVAAVVFGLPHRHEQPETAKIDRQEQEIESFRAKKQQPRRSHRKPQYRHENRPLSAAAYDTASRPRQRKQLVVDINTADTLTLQLLHGIGPAYARRIVNYRNRLGGFVRTDQLLEVYGFTDELYQHILPYLALSADGVHRIDINTVSLKQLIRHPYIDYYQARDIVALRNGGQRFAEPADLLLSPTMDDSTLLRLAPYLDFSSAAAASSTKTCIPKP